MDNMTTKNFSIFRPSKIFNSVKEGMGDLVENLFFNRIYLQGIF